MAYCGSRGECLPGNNSYFRSASRAVAVARENASSKGARYLAEARLTVERVADGELRAAARGDGTLYRLGGDPGRGWFCDYPALTRCSHLHALGRIVVVPKGNR